MKRKKNEIQINLLLVNDIDDQQTMFVALLWSIDKAISNDDQYAVDYKNL
jgi:hypothetical protein